MARPQDIQLADLLEFSPDRGRIMLEDYRMVMFSAAALGCLRKELIETVGMDEARALMKRFGHAAGVADDRALMERFPDATPEQHVAYGPALHSLEGVARVVIDKKKSVVDLDQALPFQLFPPPVDHLPRIGVIADRQEAEIVNAVHQ